MIGTKALAYGRITRSIGDDSFCWDVTQAEFC